MFDSPPGYQVMLFSTKEVFCPNCGAKMQTLISTRDTVLQIAYRCSTACAEELERKSAQSILGV